MKLTEADLAILAAVNDSLRFDVGAAAARLASLPNALAEEFLSRVQLHLADPPTRWPDDQELRTVLSEVAGKRLDEYTTVISNYTKNGIKVLDFWSQDYPGELRHVPKPPLLLYVQGSEFPGTSPIAIVGTREASAQGRQATFDFAKQLSTLGRTIVSGLARGIDTQAHMGALAAGGTTVAVFASHLGYVYPRENTALANQIRNRGAVVSETTPLVPLSQARFVERNRITSGISSGVLVGEFRGSGGTMQQVRFALTQGRPLFVISHKEFESALAKKAHDMLVGMGATSVESAEQIDIRLRELEDRRDAGARKPKRVQARFDSVSLDSVSEIGSRG